MAFETITLDELRHVLVKIDYARTKSHSDISDDIVRGCMLARELRISQATPIALRDVPSALIDPNNPWHNCR